MFFEVVHIFFCTRLQCIFAYYYIAPRHGSYARIKNFVFFVVFLLCEHDLPLSLSLPPPAVCSKIPLTVPDRYISTRKWKELNLFKRNVTRKMPLHHTHKRVQLPSLSMFAPRRNFFKQQLYIYDSNFVSDTPLLRRCSAKLVIITVCRIYLTEFSGGNNINKKKGIFFSFRFSRFLIFTGEKINVEARAHRRSLLICLYTYQVLLSYFFLFFFFIKISVFNKKRHDSYSCIKYILPSTKVVCCVVELAVPYLYSYSISVPVRILLLFRSSFYLARDILFVQACWRRSRDNFALRATILNITNFPFQCDRL